MEQQQLLSKITAVAEGIRHADYNRTVQLADIYKRIATMDGQSQLVISYKPSETEAQKKQRIEIYKSETPSVVGVIMAQFDAINGSPRIVDNIAFANENTQTDNKKRAIDAIVSRFYGRQTLQQYLEEKQRYYSLLDPNAWLIITPSSDNPIPTTIDAAAAMDFNVIGGITEFLVVGVVDSKTKAKTYIGYSGGLQLYVTEQTKGRTNYPPEEYQMLKIGSANYRVYEYEITTTETPAIRFGYIPDTETKGRTFVGIIERVVEKFKDLINQKSEYDLSLALHTFLKKYQFVDECGFIDPENRANRCRGGVMYPTGGTCPGCNGSGLKVHATSQDVILVKKPNMQEGEETVKLSEMVHYAALPFEIVNHQRERVADLVKSIPEFIFGVDLAQKPTGNVTATAINNYYNSVYMVLSPFADKISQNYIFTATVVAQMEGVATDDKIIISHRYPRIFKMETLSELLVIYQAAKAAKAPDNILWNIEKRILEIQTQDSPEQLERAKTIRKFIPFRHLSEGERIIELSQLPPDNYLRILHGYIDLVFDRVLDAYPMFMDYPDARQMEIVKQAATEFSKEITPILPTLENIENIEDETI